MATIRLITKLASMRPRHKAAENLGVFAGLDRHFARFNEAAA